MELEVRLTRSGEEPWGFRLIGGTDFNMPLTVVKVLPDTPADLACLCNGDTVSRIQGSDASIMTHDGAKAAVAAAEDSLSLGVRRGLYDPVVDEYDPIYEPIDQDDFDQPSQPTEVFEIKQFTETPLDPAQDRSRSRSRTLSRGDLDLTFNELRSLNESPFVLPTKPYRPFSTEPSPVPPLEKPIILNPDYHDGFGEVVDGNGFPDDPPKFDEFEGVLSEHSRYKLPISKHYDPDGTRLKKTKEITTVTKTLEEITVTEEIVTKEVKVTSVEEKLVHAQGERKFMENMKSDIDLDMIEMTASSIVDESIEKAITVASEIKKEIDLELSGITSESKTSSSEMMESIVLKTVKKESTKEATELIATDAVIKQSEVSVAKEVSKFEKDDKEIVLDERKEFMRQEIEETIESGSVRKKSEIYDKDIKMTDYKTEKKCIDETIESGSVRKKSEIYEKDIKKTDGQVEKIHMDKTIESGSVRRKSEMYDKDIAKKSVDETKIEKKQTKIFSDQKEVQSAYQNKSEIKSEKVCKTTESIQRPDEHKTKEAKYSTAKLLAEQRAYTIGLQTIPHIRGTVQSSYHYDLLLKTFFIHLTDVMVALSRFILAEPVLSKSPETKPEVKHEVSEVTRVSDTTVENSMVSKMKSERVELENTHIRKENVEKVADVIKQDHVRETKQQEYVDYVENIKFIDEHRDKSMLSGAEMAQLSEKRSEELINKMDGVITEFQTKAGLDEEIITQRERRSRSRSRIEEETVKEINLQERVSQVDKRTQEITEVKTISSISDSTEMKTDTRFETTDIKRESKHEIRDISSKDGKNTYISICEAHVYTNKNAILNEVVEVSETTSVESIKETNVALEANEAMVTERVAIESKTQQEQHETVPEVIQCTTESNETFSAKKEEIIIQENKNVTQEMDSQKSAVKVESKQMSNVELIETVEPIVELHEDIVEKTISVEVSNNIDIQEIEVTEIEKCHDIQDTKIIQDVQIVEEANEVQICEEICAKIEENVSLKIEDVTDLQEEIVQDEKESVCIIKEEVKDLQDETKIHQHVKVKDTKISEEMVEIKESAAISETSLEVKDEYAHLKVTKEEITEVEENVEINQEIEVNIKKSVHISESDNTYQTFISESSFENAEYIQESSFTARASQESSFTAKSIEDTSFTAEISSVTTRSTEEAKKQLTLDLDSSRKIKKSDSESSLKSTISTPTPSTVPPTPLTDEYVFCLQIPLPKLTGPPIPRSPSPEDEDPHIVKKNLVPHIDTEIVEEVVYDTPLPTPPEDKTSPPRFTKPGLKGGNVRSIFFKEEIKEIERKSSLLASAIDQTIKSIEEYKEEVGIDNNTETPVVYNGYAKVIQTKLYDDELDEVSIEKQIVKNTEKINKLVENRAHPTEDTVEKVKFNGTPATVTVAVENNVEKSVIEAGESKMGESIETVAVEGYKPVPFNPEDAPHLERVEIRIPEPKPTVDPGKAFLSENGQIMGTNQGIVDGLEDSVVDAEIAKQLGKPGMTEEKIAALISGESEMLREAHVMGLSRVLKSHMHRDNDDSSVDFKKIKPIVESLKDSEVLKALNEEFVKTQEEKKKEERKWTKFLQKPARPVPKAKFGYHGWTANDEEKESPYQVKIVKQPKPKIAPDYKPQDFNTGLLPWEERARTEPPPPPVEAEPPILVPEEKPEFFVAVDPLPESEVPDLEETGIVLPPETPIEDPKAETEPEVSEEPEAKEVEEVKEAENPEKEILVEETSNSEKDMENRVAEQLMKNVEGMVDPNAPLEQQLAQMRAQLAALAQLPGVIQQTLELVTRQLCQITQQESQSHQNVTQEQMAIESSEMIEEANENSETTIEDVTEEKEEIQTEEVTENRITQMETRTDVKQIKEVVSVSVEEREKMKREEQEILDEQRRIEKQKKEFSDETLEQEYDETREQSAHEIALRFINELMDCMQLDKEPKHMKQRPSLASVPDEPKTKTEDKILASAANESKLITAPTAVSNGPKTEKKEELIADLQLDQESRQLKQRPTPRVGKPKPVFGPLTPSERPLVLPGGRKWRKPKDAYNEQFIAETLTAQAELIQGKALGKTYESVHLPYDERVNFMKYEKPPITLDHLQHSDVYKLVHNMQDEPPRRVEMLTPVMAEADYREKCRSVTPNVDMQR